jgi:hypothetical protein
VGSNRGEPFCGEPSAGSQSAGSQSAGSLSAGSVCGELLCLRVDGMSVESKLTCSDNAFSWYIPDPGGGPRAPVRGQKEHRRTKRCSVEPFTSARMRSTALLEGGSLLFCG